MKPETTAAAPSNGAELVKRVLHVANLLAKALEEPQNKVPEDENAAKNTDTES